jgi:hypothetical protein
MNTKNTYWHFRSNTTEGSEDASVDSIMLDISRITGITMGAHDGPSINRMTIHFEKSGNTQTLHEDYVNTNGMVVLNISTGKGKEVMKDLAELSNPANSKKSYITIADDQTDTQAAEYASSYITSVYTIINT